MLGYISNRKMKFRTSICLRTLYSYIDKGVFLRLTRSHLPQRQRKRTYKRTVQSRPSRGESIEKRPGHINDRADYGHWEMDLLHGKQNTKTAVLVLTERKTREQIMIKLPDKKSETVVNVIDRLERKHKKQFIKKFKSLTVDNGSEFSNFEAIEKSKLYTGSRTKLYYCHPYSAWERGSNEKQNQMIRRHFPKGTDFTRVTQSDITSVQEWLNNYPREIFGYRSSCDLLNELKIF